MAYRANKALLFQIKLYHFNEIFSFIFFLLQGDTRCLLATPFCKSTAYRNDAQTKKEKRQLIIATTLCALFMVSQWL